VESPSRIEPTRLEQVPEALADTLAEVSRQATALGTRLQAETAASLADLVRLTNSYYSNLIEGNNTRPREIERALNRDLDEGRRNLQLEAAAHVRVQREIDKRHVRGDLAEPASGEFLCWVHREFYRDAPRSMLRVELSNGTHYQMVPGEFRSSHEHDVVVGRHHPPSSKSIPAFMAYFENAFRMSGLGVATQIARIAIAHHRFNYIHPFADGNGRVSRLMSHAMALRAGIGAHGLWSISRGLSRGLPGRPPYKQMMDYADTPRAGDLDGRGNLSLSALVEFTQWFADVMLDQVAFMNSLFDLDALGRRLADYVPRELHLGPAAVAIAQDVLLRGEIPRGDAPRITGLGERAARDALGRLVEAGLLASPTPKGPVSLRINATAAETLFPRLF
jgi:Fic family protein